MRNNVYPDMLLRQKEALSQKGYDFDTFQSKSVLERYNILYGLQEEYLGHNKLINHITPIVSVCIPTYQHRNYIRECIEGALMQQTSFPFEIVIGDDGSVDGTTEICMEYAEKYPDKIRFYNRTRELCRVFDSEGHIERSGNWWWTLQEGRGKYIAICEGDDYWINPLKLQKQVDFLENHPDYGLVHSYAKAYIEQTKKISDKLIGADFDNIDQLIIGNRIVTLTVCCRRDLYEDYLKNAKTDSSWKMGDYPMWLYFSLYFKAYFLNEVTGVYRILQSSAAHSTDINKEVDFRMNAYAISIFFINQCNKAYLLPFLKVRTLRIILYLYISQKRRVNSKFWEVVRLLKVLPFNVFVAAILSNFRFGRNYLANRYL